jgi:hypothetical protein
MSEPYCPNIAGCRLVNDPTLHIEDNNRDFYIESYCRGNNPGYSECSRYKVKNQIFFCPDFIMPDSEMTLDEILERIEQES